MGRKKKDRKTATPEAKQYVLSVLKRIHEIDTYCEMVEQGRPVMLQRGNIEPQFFDASMGMSTASFVDPQMAECDQDDMDRYLAEKEHQYLLRKGMQILNAEGREFMQDMFVQKMDRCNMMRKWHLSQSTLTRYRNETINQLALFVDEYMRWKVETLFM